MLSGLGSTPILTSPHFFEQSTVESDHSTMRGLLADPEFILKCVEAKKELLSNLGTNIEAEVGLVDLFGGRVPNRQVSSTNLESLKSLFGGVLEGISSDPHTQRYLINELLPFSRLQSVLEANDGVPYSREFFEGLPQITLSSSTEPRIELRSAALELNTRIYLITGDASVLQELQSELTNEDLIRQFQAQKNIEYKLQYLYALRIAYPDKFEELNTVLTEEGLYRALSPRLVDASIDTSLSGNTVLHYCGLARISFADDIVILKNGIVASIYRQEPKAAQESIPVVPIY